MSDTTLKLFVAGKDELDFVLADSLQEAIGFMLEAVPEDEADFYKDEANWEIYENDRIIHYENEAGEVVSGTVAEWLKRG